MCNCGSENNSSPAHPNYQSAKIPSSPRGKRQVENRLIPRAGNINARRVLTYDDEDDEMHNDPPDIRQCPSARSNSVRTRNRPDRSIEEILNLRRPRGIAIVQCCSKNVNGSLDYTGAVRRQNSNCDPRKSPRLGVALPPRGRKNCCPPYQEPPNYKVPKCCNGHCQEQH